MGQNSRVLIGCAADDFTGASDAASFLSKCGLRTVLFSGIPEKALPLGSCDAIVIGLKTRSVPVSDAVEQSIRALEWLVSIGCQQFYIKYCSTFDSTPDGNIGPVADAAMKLLQVPYTLLCPSLPVNGRTVRDGCLYVNGVPLAESPMKYHPLNPMWDSDISRLMEPQSAYRCLTVSDVELADPSALQKKLAEFGERHRPFYIIPDYETDENGKQIAARFGHLRLLTGGSGLLEHLAALHVSSQGAGETEYRGTAGSGITLCGSCSQASREQIRCFKASGGISAAVDPELLRNGQQSIDGIWAFLQDHRDEDVLVYSVGAEHLSASDAVREENARLVEQTMAELGRRAAASGYTRIIVAGGETSGAVTLALGQSCFLIGKSVAPGVPVMIPVERPEMRLVLKSGNFGQKDFFDRAIAMTKEGRA